MRQLISDFSLGMSVRDAKLSLIQVVVAVVMCTIFLFIWKRKNESDFSLSEIFILSATTAFVTIISRFYLPLAILSALAILGFLLISHGKTTRRSDAYVVLITLALSVCCGSGYVLFTGLFFVLFVIPFLLLHKSNN